MLTPISTKIEEFKEKVPKYKNNSKAIPKDDVVVQLSAFTSAISTALQQRDEEWRELVEGMRVVVLPGKTYENGLIDGRNYTVDDIITKSKENN